MKICGIKITHDSALALIDDGKLVFSVELEKVENKKRHAKFDDPAYVEKILNAFGYTKDDIDVWVVDGWRDLCGGTDGKNRICFGNETLYVNNYQNRLLGLPENNMVTGQCEVLGQYHSFTHTYTHLCGSYCTSPFAQNGENSYVMLFDGGSKPVLYYYDKQQNTFTFCDEILKFGGDIYADVSSRFEPYTDMRKSVDGKESFNLHFVGKVMAYIALGNKRSEIISICHDIYDTLSDNNCIENDWAQNRKFANEFEKRCKGVYPDVDCLASFHYFIQEILSVRLVETVDRQKYDCDNICFAGGNMLNIKWNSEIRRTGRFSGIYAPPFINDSGSAVGAVCAEWLRKNEGSCVEWNTYSGMPVVESLPLPGWNKRLCSIKELAEIIATIGEPIVMITGNCELGPRALGCRSILADPRSLEMKTVLNRIKRREAYRPVAPICIEEDAPQYFIPGTPDKYMLFEHRVTERGTEIPAIVHLDGTARLQTVSKNDNPIVYKLLSEFKKITGVSVLCNTSANFLGSGFFPDVVSVQKWEGSNYIWSEGYLYEKNEKIEFPELKH